MRQGIANAVRCDPWREGGGSPRRCEAPGMISRVHSVLVDVPDLEAAAADYARLLGRSPLRRERDPVEGSRSRLFVVGNVSLELRQHERPVEEARLGQAGLRLALADVGLDAAAGGAVVEALAARSIRVASAERVVADDEAGGAPRIFGRARLTPESSRGLPIELIHGERPGLLAERDLESEPVPAEAAVAALDHLVVLSPAPDDSLRLYRDALGLRLALDRSFEHRGVRLIFFRVGGTTIEIGARLGAEPRPERSDAFGGLAWRVPDVDAIRARLAGEGFDVSEARTGNKPGTRVCTVRGPTHGVPTLLIQPAEPD